MNPAISPLALFASMVVFSAGLLHGQALAPPAIIEKLKPSMVHVETLDMEGAGVMLTKEGLILTSYLVVALDIDLKVRTHVDFGGGRSALAEIPDVKVVKVHPEYDLALLQAVPPPGAAFVPAALELNPAQPGARCYVLGRQGQPDADVGYAISEGLVSAADRDIGGLQYIQFSAPLHPENSGGPVCDENGRVMGIATWKMMEAEGISFAVPTSRLKLAAFVPPGTRARQEKLGAELTDFGNQSFRGGMQSAGLQRELLIEQSLVAHRLALAAMPNDPVPLNNLGTLYSFLGLQDTARKFLEAALAVDPDSGNALHLLGTFVLQNDSSRVAEAVQMWLKGASNTRDKKNASVCAEDVAVAAAGSNRLAAAGYMLRWAETLHAQPRNDSPNRRSEIWQKVSQDIPAQDVALLRGFEGPFKEETFRRLEKGEPVSIFAARTKVKVSTRGSTEQAAPAVTTVSKQMTEAAEAASAKFRIAQQTVPPGGVEVPLPHEVKFPILANYGWQIVLPFPDLGKVGIFSLASGKIEGYVDCDDPAAKYAAGGSLLAIYLPSSSTLEIYDLNTLEKKAAQRISLQTPPSYLGMGLLNPNQIFALYPTPPGRGFLDPQCAPAVISLPDMKVTYPEVTQRTENGPYFVKSDTRLTLGAMDETRAVCTAVHPDNYNNGFGRFVQRPDGGIDFDRVDSATHAAWYSGFGGAAITQYSIERARIFLAGQPKDAFADLHPSVFAVSAAPIAGYPGFILWSRNATNRPEADFSIRCFGLPKLNLIHESRLQEFGKRGVNSRPLLVASAYADRVACIESEQKLIRLFPLGLSPSGADVARPGDAFSRKIHFPAGSTVTVEHAPKGMTLDAPTGTLKWQVPADMSRGQMVQAILLVKSSSGALEYHIEKIVIP